jgi:hypothetical protein
MGYKDEWKSAIRRTRDFGLSVPAHEIDIDQRYCSPEMLTHFPDKLLEGLGELDFEDLVGQCMAIHHRLAPVLEDWLQCPALFTIGWIDDGTEKGMFKFDDDFIKTALLNEHTSTIVNLHAWITLPSMEVIDVAISTSMGVLQKRPEMNGRVIASYADGLKGLAYKPMLVGDAFLRKSGLLRCF